MQISGIKFFPSLLLVFQAIVMDLNAQSIITTVAGTGTAGYTGDNSPAISAQLHNPGYRITFDIYGNYYIPDPGNNVVRKVNTSGVISTIAGTGIGGFSGDGGLATSAQLYGPSDVALDALGNIYISDQFNVRIRVINASGIINTFAGDGTQGYSGDGGPAASAKINTPTSLAFDHNGNLYIADLGQHIRKVTSTGIINTFAGNGMQGYAGDGGPATSAQLTNPWCLSFDFSGNLFLIDGNKVRKIDTIGNISGIAGNGISGYSGNGGAATLAEFNSPLGVIVDILGNIFVADQGNHVIRKINTLGIISTVVGNGTLGYSGDGGDPLLSELRYPSGVTIDTAGNLFICDSQNHAIRKVTGVAGTNEIKKQQITLNLYPNPNNGNFSINFEGKGSVLTIEVYSSLGTLILSKNNTIENYKVNTEINNLIEGLYIVKFSVDDVPQKSQRVIITK